MEARRTFEGEVGARELGLVADGAEHVAAGVVQRELGAHLEAVRDAPREAQLEDAPERAQLRRHLVALLLADCARHTHSTNAHHSHTSYNCTISQVVLVYKLLCKLQS